MHYIKPGHTHICCTLKSNLFLNNNVMQDTLFFYVFDNVNNSFFVMQVIIILKSLFQNLLKDLDHRLNQLTELRASCSNLESFEDVKDLANILNTSLTQLDSEISSAKKLTDDRLKTLQVQQSESMEKTKTRKTLLEVINSPSFIFHIFATFLLLTALAKLNNILTS